MIERIEATIENLTYAHNDGVDQFTGQPLDFSEEIETLQELILNFETVLDSE